MPDEATQPPAQGPPMVSVVVCTYERPELLKLALESLERQTAPAEDYEVIVVDNGPSEGTREVVVACDGPPRLRYVVERRTGLSRARNTGCRAARADYVAYLDDDAKAAPDWVEQMCRIIRAGDASGVFGGKYRPFYLDERPPWIDDSFELHDMGDRPLRRTEPPLIWGSNMIIRKELIERLGGFRPEFGMSARKVGYGEDTEFQMRLLREIPEEEIWYFPQLVIEHLTRPEQMTMRGLAVATWSRARAYAMIMADEGRRYSGRRALADLLLSTARTACELLRGLRRDRARFPYYQHYFARRVAPRIGQSAAAATKLRICLGRRFGRRRLMSASERPARSAEPSLEMTADCEEGLVSVIIPTHNRGWIIARTLESVRAQTYRPIEIVVVDDGSTDETEEVVRAFAESAEQGLTVRYVRQEQQGANAARNRGLEESRGEFIQFLDSDDLLLPDKLSDQVAVMQTEPQVKYVFSIYDVLDDETGEVIRRWPDEFCAERASLLDVLVTLTPRPIFSICSINGLYRRSVCRRIGPWETRWQIHDRLYNAKLLALDAAYRYIPSPHVLVRRHVRERHSAHAWEPVRLASHRLGWHELQRVLREAGCLTPERREILADSYLKMARLARQGGGEGLARALEKDARQATAGGERVRMWRAALAERLLRVPFVGEALWVAQREGVLGVLRRAPGRLLGALAGRSRRPGSRELLARSSSEEGDR